MTGYDYERQAWFVEGRTMTDPCPKCVDRILREWERELRQREERELALELERALAG